VNPSSATNIVVQPESGENLDMRSGNRAENPPCAFTPYATCPLAPGATGSLRP
jgi:uncharacterized protein (DUF1684 family)